MTASGGRFAWPESRRARSARERTHEILERVWGLAHHLAVKEPWGEIAWLS